VKLCTNCNSIKEFICFNKSIKYKDGLSYYCKDCINTHKREKYKENLEENRKYTNLRRAKSIKWFQELKSNIPCIDCNKIYEPYCMDYDHIPERGIKIKNVSRMILDNASENVVLEEIKKCDLVCLLCHNKRTHIRINEKFGEIRSYKPHQVRNINIINSFKNKACAKCNIQYESFNMQIDHIYPLDKLYDVCGLKSCKENTLQNELIKCQVLCALCHRKKSIIEQKQGKYSIRNKVEKQRKLFYDNIKCLKECGLCHNIKEIIDFRKNIKAISGADTYCKLCFNEYRRKIRKLK
jgi:hypothetical protein